MNDHLGKPVEPDELLAKLREWIVRGRNPATAEI
jgi:DNA-binding response OmpR family regulator